jgi:hypothetical protein
MHAHTVHLEKLTSVAGESESCWEVRLTTPDARLFLYTVSQVDWGQ